MENKKVYEEGTVEITTTEYKDIIIEMVEHKKDAERYLSEKYDLKEKLKATQEELFETQKRVVELEARLADLAWAEHQSANTEEVANNG
jgi:uncharacterized protein YlxW (UPF0749 family)